MVNLNLFTFYWSSVFLFIQFFYLSIPYGFDLREGRVLFFLFSSILSLMIFKIDADKINKKYFALILLPLLAIYKMYDMYSFNVVFQTLGFSLGILVFFQFLSIRLDQKTLSVVFGVSCIVQSLWIVANILGFDLLELFYAKVNVNSEMTGGLGNRGYSGGLIAILTPFLMTRYTYFLTLIPLVATLVIFSEKTQTPLALMLAVFTLYGLNGVRCYYQKTGLFLLRFFPIVFGIYLFFMSGDIRHNQWLRYLDLPLYRGMGLGWLVDNAKYLMTSNQIHVEAHNEYIEAILAFGPWSVILFFVTLTVFWKVPSDLVKFRFWVSSVVAMLYAISWFPMHLATVAIVVLICGAVVTKRGENV